MAQKLQIIEPIKDAMLAFLQINKATLGVKNFAKDLLSGAGQGENEVEALIAKFPAIIVSYYGRTAKREGTTLITVMTFSVVVATQNFSAPHASEVTASNILDGTLSLLQGKNVEPSIQNDYFTFAGEVLQQKDKVLTIYQQLWDTQVGLDFRDALKSTP